MADIGYARVSRLDQDPALQLDALQEAGCAKVFEEKGSGAKPWTERAQLDAALDYIRPGDTLVVWALDRLGRSTYDLIRIVADLKARGVGFRSIREPGIDSTTEVGELVLMVFAWMAEQERRRLIERTRAGLAAAKRRGKVGGRPRVLTPAKERSARALLAAGDLSLDEVAATVGVSRRTLGRYLQTRQPESVGAS